MTKTDILKRLEPMNNDKVVVFVDSCGGWANIEDLVERDSTIELTVEETPLFADN